MNLNKSCLALVDCSLKYKCDLYKKPKTEMFFSPPTVGEFCHYFVPRDEDHDND